MLLLKGQDKSISQRMIIILSGKSQNIWEQTDTFRGFLKRKESLPAPV